MPSPPGFRRRLRHLRRALNARRGRTELPTAPPTTASASAEQRRQDYEDAYATAWATAWATDAGDEPTFSTTQGEPESESPQPHPQPQPSLHRSPPLHSRPRSEDLRRASADENTAGSEQAHSFSSQTLPLELTSHHPFFDSYPALPGCPSLDSFFTQGSREQVRARRTRYRRFGDDDGSDKDSLFPENDEARDGESDSLFPENGHENGPLLERPAAANLPQRGRRANPHHPLSLSRSRRDLLSRRLTRHGRSLWERRARREEADEKYEDWWESGWGK